MQNSGIYKITNPKGKVYIGQSIDLKKRYSYYKRLRCEKQRKLYASLKKYGFENHVFEILELCDLTQLNERERFFQDKYNVIEKGLNLQLVSDKDNNGKHSEETKEILRQLNLGKKHKKSTIELMRLKNSGKNHANYGKKLSKELIAKRSESRSQVILNLQTGVFYSGVKDAANSIGISRSYLNHKLLGNYKNDTYLTFV